MERVRRRSPYRIASNSHSPPAPLPEDASTRDALETRLDAPAMRSFGVVTTVGVLAAALVITVLPHPDAANERESWGSLAASGLTDAYGPDEPEYSLDLLEERNPEYAAPPRHRRLLESLATYLRRSAR